MAQSLRRSKQQLEQRDSALEPEDGAWEAWGILEEDLEEDGRLVYLINWKDHPTTGESFEPSWIYAELADPGLVAEWDFKTANTAKNNRKKRDRKTSRGEKRGQDRSSLDQAPQPKKRRQRVVESSSQSSRASANLAEVCTPPRFEPEPDKSTAESAPHTSFKPRVQIQLGANIDQAEFDLYSQLPPSFVSLDSSRDTLFGSSQASYSRSRDYRSSGVVGDSEAEEEDELVDGSASYRPSTQENSQLTLDTNHITSASQTQDQQCPSPSTIPETQSGSGVDIIHDSQSLGGAPVCTSQEQRRVIPDTFETIISTSQPEQAVAEDTSSSQASAGENRPAIVAQLPAEAQAFLSNSSILTSASVGPTVAFNCTASVPRAVAALRIVLSQRRLRTCTTLESSPAFGPEAQPTSLEGFRSTHSPSTNQSLIGTRREDQSPAAEAEALAVKLALQTASSTFVHTGLEIHRSEHWQDAALEAVAELEAQDRVDHASRTPSTVSSQRRSPSPLQSFESASRLVSKGIQDAFHHGEDPAFTEERLSVQQIERPAASISRSSNSRSVSEPASFEQYAQAVSTSAECSTQDTGSQHVLPTIEDNAIEQVPYKSPSRHDSSQGTPEPFTLCVDSSSLRGPPVQSLEGVDSHAPARPFTPVHSSQMSEGASQTNSMNDVLKAAIARREKEMTSPLQLAKNAISRSPSTIPERAQQTLAPTALRTVEVPENAEAEASTSSDAVPVAPIDGEGETSTSDDALAATTASNTSGLEDSSDIDDNMSLLNDDLSLSDCEFIVPLPINGRQADTYRNVITNNMDTLRSFLDDPQRFGRLDDVEGIIEHLRAIETHVDILCMADSDNGGQATQVAFQAQWSSDNSMKFRFLGALIRELRSQSITHNATIVIEEEDTKLRNIVEIFLRAHDVEFSSLTLGASVDLENGKDRCHITLLPSTYASTTRTPNLIICFDGQQEAAALRRRPWAQRLGDGKRVIEPLTGGMPIPILHLVIPRTIDHIQRYVSPALSKRKRLHTIVATLAQFYESGDLGCAIEPSTPDINHSARLVAEYTMIQAAASVDIPDWPLPSIGSIKDIIEYQSQQALAAITSPPIAPSSKRPLQDEESNPIKRIRLTPQPQVSQPVSKLDRHQMSQDQDITHISDSMPGTSAQMSQLQARLQALQQELEVRKDTEAQLRERLAGWSRQQEVHENLSRSFNKIKNEGLAFEKKLEAATERETKLRERMQAKSSEYQELQGRFKQLQETALLSEDQKVVELVQMRKDVAEAKEAEQRALASKRSIASNLEYTTKLFQDAQAVATEAQQEARDLLEQNTSLSQKASGDTQALRKLHLDAQDKLKDRQIDSLNTELMFAKRQLQTKEDEVARLKNGRNVGVGTRAQSVGPKLTKPGSRAASPMPGMRDRVSNLRHG